jgi:hypothetical protein
MSDTRDHRLGDPAMSQPSPDAPAVVRAFDGLTTQVRRIADALSTPVVEQTDAPDGAPTTGSDDGPRCVCGDLIELTGDPAVWRHAPGSIFGLDAHTPRPPDWLKAGTRDLSIPAQAPVADEDAQRTTRRASLRNLLSHAARIRFSVEEAELLRQLVETEMREADTARAVVADHRVENRALRKKLERYGTEAQEQRTRAEQSEVVHPEDPAQATTPTRVDDSGTELAAAEVARLRAGEELGGDYPSPDDTPGQWIWWWNRATAEQRLDVAATVLSNHKAASQCFLENHRSRIARAQKELGELTWVEGELEAAQAALERVGTVAPDLEFAATGIGLAEPAREAMRDAARRIRTALQTPSYVLNTTAVVPAWRHNPDGTWSLTVGEGVLTVPPSTSPARRAQFLLAYISLSAGGWTVRPAADASGHSSNYEGPPLAEETP